MTSPEHEDARGTLGGETRLEVVSIRAQRVFGRLVDEDKRPVATVSINLSYTTTTSSKDAEGHEHRSTSVEGHRDSVVSREDGTFSFFRQQPAAVQIAPKKTGSLPELLVLPALGEEAERSQLDLGDLVLRKGRMLTGRVAKTTVASRSRAPGSRRSGEPGRAFPSGASGPPRRRTGRSGSTGSSPAPRSR